MISIVPRLDKTQIFWNLDDFYGDFEVNYAKRLKLSTDDKRIPCQSQLCLSEVMTIVILFHGSGYKTFKEFYLDKVLPHWRPDFPKLVSYNRFVELIPWSLMLLSCFLHTRRGKMTGRALYRFNSEAWFVILVEPKLEYVFGDLPQWGKNSVGWYYGFKLQMTLSMTRVNCSLFN